MLKSTFLFISSIFWQDSIPQLIDQQAFPVAASIRRMDTGREVFQHRGTEWISPASTWKIVSVAFAKQKLGSAYRFQTPVYHTGSIQEKTLWGDLVIQGSGDPTLGSSRWPNLDPIAQLISSLKSLGIRQIQGQIRLKNLNSFNQIPDSWTWGDMGNYYGAVPQVFNFEENKFTVYFQAGTKMGSPSSIVSIQPKSTTWTIENQVTTGPLGSGDQVLIYSAPGSRVITLRGTVPLGSQHFPVKGSIHDPFQVFQELLKSRLYREGIDWIPAETPDHSPENKLVVWESPTIQEIGEICLAESVNLFADALLKKAWSPVDFLSWDGLKSMIPSTELPTPFWQDGSGLSSQTILQPTRFTEYLIQISRQNEPEGWISWLPQLGKSGTVKSFSPVGIPVYVKSGSIQGVRTYAGYFKSKRGIWYAFFVGAYPLAPDQSRPARNFFQTFFAQLNQY